MHATRFMQLVASCKQAFIDTTSRMIHFCSGQSEGALVSWPGSSRVIIPEQVINLFQIFLSRHLPALNSPGDQGHFWSCGGSKKFQTSYLPGLGIITRLDPGDETSAPLDVRVRFFVHYQSSSIFRYFVTGTSECKHAFSRIYQKLVVFVFISSLIWNFLNLCY